MLNYAALREIADQIGRKKASLMYPPDEKRRETEAFRIADAEYRKMVTPPLKNSNI